MSTRFFSLREVTESWPTRKYTKYLTKWRDGTLWYLITICILVYASSFVKIFQSSDIARLEIYTKRVKIFFIKIKKLGAVVAHSVFYVVDFVHGKSHSNTFGRTSGALHRQAVFNLGQHLCIVKSRAALLRHAQNNHISESATPALAAQYVLQPYIFFSYLKTVHPSIMKEKTRRNAQIHLNQKSMAQPCAPSPFYAFIGFVLMIQQLFLSTSAVHPQTLTQVSASRLQRLGTCRLFKEFLIFYGRCLQVLQVVNPAALQNVDILWWLYKSWILYWPSAIYVRKKVDTFMLYETRCKEWRWKRSFISSFSFFFIFFYFYFFVIIITAVYHNNDASHAFWWLAKTRCTCKTRSHIEVPGLIKTVGRLHCTAQASEEEEVHW